MASRPSRLTLAPPGVPDPGLARLVTWNINGVRARATAVLETLDRLQPDVVAVQETKITDLPATVLEQLAERGYQAVHIGDGGYNGVALLSRWPVRRSVVSGGFGVGALDREPRVVAARLESPAGELWAVSVYVPNGRELRHWHFDYKLEFLDQLPGALAGLADGAPLFVAGDWNVAPTDADVYDPAAFRGCTHVTPEERAALSSVFERLELEDLDACLHGAHARRYTWFNYRASCYPRNRGLRIDLAGASASLAARTASTWVDHVARRAERPSDHAAVVVDLHNRPASRG